MKKITIAILAFFVLTNVSGQPVDQRIGDAMNNKAWRELRQLDLSEGENIQTPFLKPLSKFFISHYFNQPDSAIHYGGILLEEHQTELGGSVEGIIYFMSDNLARLGHFEEASSILHAYNKAVANAGLPVNEQYINFEHQYRVLHQFGGFSMQRPDKTVKIPFRYHSKLREDPVMIFTQVVMNGETVDVTYDTGAGVNIISSQKASEINAHIIDSIGINVHGISSQSSQFAIVDSIRLGSILYTNVPFQVMDFATGNKEADDKRKEMNFQCILGSQTMMPLGEIQFDFEQGQLIIPSKPSATPNFAPNMYRSESNQFIVDLYDYASKDVIDALLDTGASYSMLTSTYYNKNKNIFKDVIPTDTIRYAGSGGVNYAKTFNTSMKYKVGDRTAHIDSINVAMDEGEKGFKSDFLFGLNTLTSFDKVTINFTDMWIKMD